MNWARDFSSISARLWSSTADTNFRFGGAGTPFHPSEHWTSLMTLELELSFIYRYRYLDRLSCWRPGRKRWWHCLGLSPEHFNHTISLAKAGHYRGHHLHCEKESSCWPTLILRIRMAFVVLVKPLHRALSFQTHLLQIKGSHRVVSASSFHLGASNVF